MGVASGSEIIVKLAEGAVVGHDALRQQVLAELAAEAESGDTGGMPENAEEEGKVDDNAEG